MGKWKYIKQEPSNVRGLCCKCGKHPQKKAPHGKFRSLCSNCSKREYEGVVERNLTGVKKYDYRHHKTDTCMMCSFTSEYPCQFDVDHIDGNHYNNDLSNLQTLCANCHRLKTLLNGEGIYRNHK